LRGFRRATELDPTVADYWAFLALVHSQTGNMHAAEISVKKALSLNHAQDLTSMHEYFYHCGQNRAII
tara:strand:+ start:386 stop:589 length:204 start_codon:yes stop_codon:yes gene_type:complete